MAISSSDLTAYARIRNAALEGFARNGAAATSIRDVARAAGVSPSLVQHHFSSKAALVGAINDYVVAIATEAFSQPLDPDSSCDVIEQLGDRITAFVAEHPVALLYVARAAADGEPAALEIFDALVGLARAQVQSLERRGLLHAGADIDWIALHMVVFNLGTVLFQDAINRRLPQPFFSPEQLQRWNEATTSLFRRGMSRL